MKKYPTNLWFWDFYLVKRIGESYKLYDVIFLFCFNIPEISLPFRAKHQREQSTHGGSKQVHGRSEKDIVDCKQRWIGLKIGAGLGDQTAPRLSSKCDIHWFLNADDPTYFEATNNIYISHLGWHFHPSVLIKLELGVLHGGCLYWTMRKSFRLWLVHGIICEKVNISSASSWY